MSSNVSTFDINIFMTGMKSALETMFSFFVHICILLFHGFYLIFKNFEIRIYLFSSPAHPLAGLCALLNIWSLILNISSWILYLEYSILNILSYWNIYYSTQLTLSLVYVHSWIFDLEYFTLNSIPWIFYLI